MFGFVRNTTRVRGVIAASTASSAKLKSGVRHHRHDAAADDLRVEAKDLEGRFRNDRFGNEVAAGGRPQVRDGDRHDAFVEPVHEREAVGVDAEIARAGLA